jgi:alkanesulfonate monooxygenase SsuD/methylene tetrahydromethanopterin reductase-like flavin-dependent oxidoreductase (luciferase family)
VRYAVSLPNFGMDTSARSLAALAADAEAAGWDGFFLWDHLLAFAPGPVPVVDPWVALTAAALATARIRLGTMVTPLPRRRPVRLARETASLDHLCGGRLILGVGIGALPYEWEYLGEEPDPAVRGAMLDEGLEVLTGLWTGEPFGHRGGHYRVAGSGPDAGWRAICYPPPAQRPRIPIWVAGTWPTKAPFRRAARWDGVVPIKAGGEMTPEDVRAMVAFIAVHRTADGPFEIVVAGASPGGDAAAAQEAVAPMAAAGGTWWVEAITPWRFGWEPGAPWPGKAMRERVQAGPPDARN